MGFLEDLYNISKSFFHFDVAIKVTSSDDVNRPQKVLEYGDRFYIVVENNSNKRIGKTKLKYSFAFDGKEIAFSEEIPFLNSKEKSRVLLKLGEIIKVCPELFEERIKGDVSKKIPKKTLKISLMLTLNRFNFLKIQEDSFFIEWGSMESYHNFKDHPVINIWNQRKGKYIYKR